MQISVDPPDHFVLRLTSLELGWLKAALASRKQEPIPSAGDSMADQIVRYEPIVYEAKGVAGDAIEESESFL